MSFERFVMVVYPFSKKQLNNHAARICIIFIWLYAFAVTCPPLFGWGAYVSEAADIRYKCCNTHFRQLFSDIVFYSCSVNWEHRNVNATTYIVFLFTSGLVIPLIIISFCYIIIIAAMKKVRLLYSFLNTKT